MDLNVNQLVQTLAIYALPVLFAITLHEAAHGYVARHFGDMTAHAQGRISLNPVRHIDFVGTIAVPLVILLLSGNKFLFGWAKPVPVNFSALRKPRQHMAWVAAAGPGANLLMALLWVALLKLAVLMPHNGFWLFVGMMAEAGIVVNLLFMFLNLIPILPLDGGRILASLLPRRAAGQYARLEPLGLPLLIVLLLTNVLNVVLEPLMGASDALIRALVF
ncbi:MAG TPA: site-2 protease family protein [Burkholderiales bacterium]|jgi:Zn-dependent protease|nr:site-2 protease family protein [Burkholderiales bacterium]